MYRHILCIVGLIAAAACRQGTAGPPVPVVDLLRHVHVAEKRPPNGFELAAHAAEARVRPAIVAAVPSRLTIPVRVPHRAALRTAVTLLASDPSTTVRFRVGVSDDRIYEALAERVVHGGERGWMEFGADLSAYAGFKWSLFYRPDRITWRLVLAADAIAGAPARAVWGTPEIVADEISAREYGRRIQRSPRP